MHTLTKQQQDFFRKNGYIHVQKVFSEHEIQNFRKGCRLNKPGDSSCRPEFSNIMLSQKVIDIVKDLIGDEIIYPCLSLTRTNDLPQQFGSRFFHTDTVGDDNNFDIEYPIINTGVYLQDYIDYSGTLKIMPGSHTRQCITSRTLLQASKHIVKYLLRRDMRGVFNILNLHRSINIPTMPGDMIIWYVRTHHSGYGIRPRFFPNWSLPPIIENWIPSFLKLPDNPERNVILSIFAAPSKYLETYIQKQITKAHRREHYLNNACFENEEMKALAKKEGVTIRNDGHHYIKNSTT